MRHLGPAFCRLMTLAVGVGQSAASFAAGQAVTTSPGRQNPELTLIKEVLADGVYLFRAPTALDRWTATNVVVVLNQDDVTVFDSFTRPATARMAIAEIRALTSKPVRTLINSHWHMDHWSGNDEFRKAFPGIQIVASAETRGYYKADDIAAAVNLDAIGRQYPQGQIGPATPFGQMVARLVRKAAQEALDGIVK
jgi:hypothetical protein